jgi:hypothetical protein
MDHQQDLIDLIKSAPAIQPPDEFTPGVMAAVMQTKEGSRARAWDFFSMPREFTLDPISDFRSGTGNMELVWHFFIAGFVYAIIGTSLLIGFEGIKHITTLSEWISLQPFLWLASALMFMFCGVVLYAGANRGLNLVRSYLFFHIGFAIINGIFIGLSSALPLTIMFTVLFAMPIIIIVSSLVINKNKTRKFLTQGEIFSHAVQ